MYKDKETVLYKCHPLVPSLLNSQQDRHMSQVHHVLIRCMVQIVLESVMVLMCMITVGFAVVQVFQKVPVIVLEPPHLIVVEIVVVLWKLMIVEFAMAWVRIVLEFAIQHRQKDNFITQLMLTELRKIYVEFAMVMVFQKDSVIVKETY